MDRPRLYGVQRRGRCADGIVRTITVKSVTPDGDGGLYLVGVDERGFLTSMYADGDGNPARMDGIVYPGGIVYQDSHVGCHLDGALGWRNIYRVVDMATHHGMVLDAEAIVALDMYRDGMVDTQGDWWEIVCGRGGLTDQATEFLGTITAPGLEWVWDAGELSLIPSCQTEDPTAEAECDHCERGAAA